jgi:predicted Zn-dependent protease
VSPQDEALWQQLSSRLLNLPELKQYKWKIYFLKNDVPNAFALPGGIIGIHTGLIKQSESPEEILGVLAHEIGHVMSRHGVQRIAGEMTIQVLSTVLFSKSSNLISVADNLQSLQFSRTQELEADNLGLLYLQRANISPAGFSNFFKRAKSMSGEKWVSWLSTHPMNEERLAHIEILKANFKNPAKINFPLKKFKEIF